MKVLVIILLVSSSSLTHGWSFSIAALPVTCFAPWNLFADPHVGFYVHHAKHGAGHLIIHPPTIPTQPGGSFLPARLEFTTIRHVTPDPNLPIDPVRPEVDPHRGHLVISINDLVSLKKEGMSWPGRIATSWALDAEGAGGTGLELKIVRKDLPTHQTDIGHKNKEQVGVEEREEVLFDGKEELVKFKGIVRRNELFNRLIAVGEQRWEMW
jgi:hypothetical protein